MMPTKSVTNPLDAFSPSSGGPAFPIRIDDNTVCFGMLLRDYFAGLAMQSMFAGPGAQVVADRDERYDESNWAEVVALNAYEMADAMLKVRGEE